MKVIEDIIVEKVNTPKVKKPIVKEENLSPEERKYRSAVQLMESVECITRFEHAVIALNAAAELFDALGEYKDSPKKKELCGKKAHKIETSGKEKAYQAAVRAMEAARTNIDYRIVISEFARFPEYKDSQEKIDLCKKKLEQMADRKVWKNRGITVAILAVAAVIFYFSPAFPYTKGIIRMKQGHYKIAITHFSEAGDFLNSRQEKKKCHYQQALKAQDAGNTERALLLCKKAEGYKQADYMAAQLEIDKIKRASAGDQVAFGHGNWQVLSNQSGQLVLWYSDPFVQKAYDKDDNDWGTSHVRKWLNKHGKEKLFNQGEKKLLQPVQNALQKEKEDRLYLLDAEEYARYKEQLGQQNVADAWWLRSTGSGQNRTDYVDPAGDVQSSGTVTEEKEVRPVVTISLDTSVLDLSITPPTQQ